MQRILGILAATALTACAGDTYIGARLTTVQGKYDHMSCEQLAPLAKSTQTRIDELAGLRSKAAQESSGSVIGAVVYGPTLAESRANLRIIRETQAQKNCPSEPAAGR